MASLSSSSVSGSSSLGNTSLRGFGGLSSGIDRDAIIEQMSLATNTKISNQKSAMTKLEWKQEAYRSVTDKVMDLMDKYASYSSTSNLKDPTIFSKSLVSTHGAETSTRFVTATGTSALVDNVSISGVKQLATSTVRQSNAHISSGGLKTSLGNDFSGDVGDSFSYPSNIKGRQITVGIWNPGQNGAKPTLGKSVTYTFEDTYKVMEDGKEVTKTISYTPEKGQEPDAEFYKNLTNQLNEALKASDDEIMIDENNSKKLSDIMEFNYNETSGQIEMIGKNTGGYTFGISQNSSALKGVGVKAEEPIQLTSGSAFVKFDADKTVTKQTTIDYLTNKSLIFEYDGTQKTVSLLTSQDAAYLKNDENFKDEQGNALTGEDLANAKLKEMKSRLQDRLDTAFGKDAIKVNVDEDGEPLTFNTSNPTSAVAILSKDDTLLKNLGLEFGASNKVNIDGKLDQDALGLKASDYTNANGQLDLKINGVSITGLTANSTVSDILSKINSTKAAGVKATYVEATGQFMLVSSETGAGRTISLDSDLSKALFGGSGTNEQGHLVDGSGNILAQKDAEGNFWHGLGSGQNVEKMDASGNLVDKDGNILATKDASGNFWVNAADGTRINRVDASGNYLNADGKFISEDGRLVNGSGYLVDDQGRMITGEKDKVIKDGVEVEVDQFIDKNGYRINEKGQFIDANGRAINKDGHYIDENNNLIDKDGNRVDKDGYLLSEDGKAYMDKDGNRINKQGYLIDENGNYLNSVNGDRVKKDEEDGNWYQVDKNGNYLATSSDGREISIKKDADGNWYEVDEDNKFVTNDDGEKAAADVSTRKSSAGAAKGAGVPADADDTGDGRVKTEADTASALVKTDVSQYKKGIQKLENLAETIDYGKNAKIEVSYGNGIYVDLERSSNTFNLEGLTVTVSGVFGGEYKKDDNGNVTDTWVRDTSQAVTFTAKADVDAAVERVKSFMEDFNAMISEINGQVTTRPDSSYGPLTDEQKEEMDETSIENWEKKAKQGILFNDDVMRDLSSSTQGILSKLMSYGVNYQDLEKIGITYSEDYTDGGTLVFDESKFRSAMESDPELVSNIFTGGGDVKKGLIDVVEETLTPFATRYASKNGGSYGRLVEVAGTEKKPTTLLNNQIYKELKEMEETITKLREKLKVEQDRYISQFTTMETLINKMNTQSSYLSQITG